MVKLHHRKSSIHLNWKKAVMLSLTDGKHTGEHGIVEHVTKDLIKIKGKEEVFETPRDYVFVIGKEKPSIKLFE